MILRGNLYKLSDILDSIAAEPDPDFSYSLYWKDQERPAQPDDLFLVDAPVEVTEDFDEVYPPLARESGLWIYCSDELIQDVVGLAVEQKPTCSHSDLVQCLEYYMCNDTFLDLD